MAWGTKPKFPEQTLIRQIRSPAHWIMKRLFSNLMAKGRANFTPKLSENLSKSFEESFPQSESVSVSETLSLQPQSTKFTPNYNNFVQPGRTYREELYASRRFELNPSQNPNYAFKKLHTFLQDEKIPQKIKENKYFIRPGLVKHAVIYAGRRKKFNSLVRETINKIVKINESQK